MKILVVKTHRLGDVVQALPLVRALREAHPDAEIHYLVSARYAVLLEGNPDIDRIIAWKMRPTDPDAPSDLVVTRVEGENELVSSLSIHFDLLINLNPDSYSALLCSALSADHRVGCLKGPSGLERRGPIAPWLATVALFRPLTAMNLVDAFQWNTGLVPTQNAWYTHPGDPAPFFENLGLSLEKPAIAIQFGSADAYRRWAPARYAEVAKALRERGLQVAVLGSPAEAEMAASICEPSGAVFAAGLDIRGLRAFLKGCSGLVGNDTGPMHLAASLGIKGLSLFSGPSVARETGGYFPGAQGLAARVSCIPCSNPDACTVSFACREQMSVEAVIGTLVGGPLPEGIQRWESKMTGAGMAQVAEAAWMPEEWAELWLGWSWLCSWGPQLPPPGKPVGDVRPLVEAMMKAQRSLLKGEMPQETRGTMGLVRKVAEVLPKLLKVCPEEKRKPAEILRKWGEAMG